MQNLAGVKSDLSSPITKMELEKAKDEDKGKI